MQQIKSLNSEFSMNFYIGHNNFYNTQWAESFYPEDIPGEWKFDYYSNEFECLYIEQESQLDILAKSLSESFVDSITIFINKSLQRQFQLNSDIDEFMTENFIEFIDGPVKDGQGNYLSLKTEAGLIICIDEGQYFSAKDLSQFYQQILKVSQDSDSIYVFFPDHIQAIEQARNFKLITQLS